MRIERASVSTLVIFVNYWLPRCRRAMVNKWLTGPPSLPDLRSVSPPHDVEISVT